MSCFLHSNLSRSADWASFDIGWIGHIRAHAEVSIHAGDCVSLYFYYAHCRSCWWVVAVKYTLDFSTHSISVNTESINSLSSLVEQKKCYFTRTCCKPRFPCLTFGTNSLMGSGLTYMLERCALGVLSSTPIPPPPPLSLSISLYTSCLHTVLS